MQTDNNLAYVYDLKGNPAMAQQSYMSSLDLALELGDRFQEEIVRGNLGQLFYRNGEFDKSREFYTAGLKIAVEIKDMEGQAEMHNGLAILYDRLNKPLLALDHIKAYMKDKKVLDSLNNAREKQSEVARYEFEKEKLALIKDQEKYELIQQARRKKQLYVIYSVSICLLIVAIFCVLLYKRFQLTRSQKLVIEDQKKLVEEKQKEIVDSINYAKRIQDSLFDNTAELNHLFSENFVLYRPKDIVSGDFYWISRKKQEAHGDKSGQEFIFIAICDSTGHGVPGGFMSLLNAAYLSEAINEKDIVDPAEVLDYVRKRLVNSISKNKQKDGFDGALLRIQRKGEDATLAYAAAHNAPLMVREGKLFELESDKMPVGFGERPDLFRSWTLDLKRGDVVYTFTDGFADQFGGPKGKKFKSKQLYELLLKNWAMPMEEQKTQLNLVFENWKGALEQVDDVLVTGIRI